MALEAVSGASLVRQLFPGRLSIQHSFGTLTIDSTQPRREMGYYGFTEFVSQNTAYALKQLQRGIADTVAAGDAMMRIEHGGNALRSLALQRAAVRELDTQIVLGFMPLSPPQVSFTPGTLRIDVVY